MMNLFIELTPEVKKEIENDSVIELNKILTEEDPKTAQVVLDDVTLKFLNYIKRSKALAYFKDQKHSEDIRIAGREIERLATRIQDISNPNR